MRIFIAGGTGFLGYHAALEFVRRGHSVATLSTRALAPGTPFPQNISVDSGDVFRLTRGELMQRFKGFDAMVYAIGPDDRYIPDAPAYRFFHERLVNACTNVFIAAREAGIRRSVLLGSYFAYFDRIRPRKRLSERHPYIKCRVEQSQSVLETGAGRMDVMILELPYIFGVMPGRIPFWKEVLVDRIRTMNPVLFTRGGTSMIAVEHVAEAIVGAVDYGKNGERYSIGDVNMNWKDMLSIMLTAMGQKKRILTIPVFLASLYGRMLKNTETKHGKEAGLDHALLFRDIQSEFFYLDPKPSMDVLRYSQGGIEEAIAKTVKACFV